MKTQLSVNVDHVATLRQARRTPYPEPVEAALLAEEAGASGITAHLRADRRHIQDDDLARLRERVRGKLNLEISTAREMIEIALARRPDQVTLVPERPDELTTEGGLDLVSQGSRVLAAATDLAANGIAVSVFIDPDPAQIEELDRLSPGGDGLIAGFEINTDAYTKRPEEDAAAELAKIRRVSALGAGHGFAVYAGHGLTTGNVGPVSALPEIEELNIGHALISRAVLVGIEGAVVEMVAAME